MKRSQTSLMRFFIIIIFFFMYSAISAQEVTYLNKYKVPIIDLNVYEPVYFKMTTHAHGKSVIWDESSYDKHHIQGEDLYRVGIVFGDSPSASSPAPMAEGFKANFPEIVQSTRLFKYPMLESMLLTREAEGDTKIFKEAFGYYVDSTFFDVFTYQFLSGNATSVLREPNTMVLSASLAEKLFSKMDPVGEVENI